ncbi:C-type lectin domain family 4 member M-like [Oncorhynchus clarkii lewisi]|uniref:C-type lectin domain family 4 member M-like n=1 Tax=Oncorhynchus clarkii lewisi TaxID=490388 RepID=UPI0039B98E68
MSEAIYAVPDMTKKVKFNRGEIKERIVDIYVSADTLRDGETSTTREETADTAPNNGPGDQHSDSNVSKNSSAERDQLQTSYNNLTKERYQLQTSYNNLTKERYQLETKYNNLTKERYQLQTSYNNLTKERYQLQTSYNNLTKERDQLQTSYNNLTKERYQLQTSYNNLTKERYQLETKYNNLTKEKDQLQTRYNNLTNERCPEGWQKFESSWYFLSTETKTWKESREDCLERGADLVIINSDKEQEFLFNLNKRVWIGLTDSVNEKTWKWVDGTPLTTGYWYYPQPDNAGPTQNEDCVEIHNDQLPLNAWNDLSCDSQLNWICEKAFYHHHDNIL